MTLRDRKVIVIVAVLAVIVGGWLFVLGPKRSQAAKLGDQLKAAQSQLDSARAQVVAGESAKAGFARNYTVLARLGEAVPVDDNVPSLIYQLQGAATAAHVDFRALNLTPAGAGSPPPPSSSPPSSSPAASSGATGASVSSPSAVQASTASLPPGATVGPAGFPIEPFTFTFQGNFFRLADFLGRIERFVVAANNQVSVSGRLITLNAISLGPASGSFPEITASIAATTYLVPAAQGLLNGATSAGPSSPQGGTATAQSGPRVAPAAVVNSPVR